MGTVHASTAQPGVPPDFAPPPPPPPAEGDKKDKIILDLPTNPGPLEDLHKKVKDLMPICFEGARVIVNKGLSNNFQVSHTLNMSNVTPSGYRFGATYVGKTHYSPEDASPILMGDIDPSGNLNAQCISHLSARLKGKMVAQIQENKYVATQFTGEYSGVNYTATASAGNLDFKAGSGVVVAQYLQNFRPRVALGAELAYQYAPHIPGGGASVLSLAGRYTGDQYVVAGTLGTVSAHASYYLKTNPSTQVGVEVETNFRIGDSVATLAYQVDMPKGNLVFRGMVDSTWTVGAVMEKRLAPLPFTFCMSAMLNHAKGSSRLGLGLIVDVDAFHVTCEAQEAEADTRSANSKIRTSSELGPHLESVGSTYWSQSKIEPDRLNLKGVSAGSMTEALSASPQRRMRASITWLERMRRHRRHEYI